MGPAPISAIEFGGVKNIWSGLWRYLLAQPAAGELLHLVNGEGAVHVHGGLVGLVAEEVLYPFSRESFGFEPSGYGVAEDVG